MGILLAGQVSMAPCSHMDHRARPLTTAHEPVKTQAQGLLPLFKSSITVTLTACNSAQKSSSVFTFFNQSVHLLVSIQQLPKEDAVRSRWNCHLKANGSLVVSRERFMGHVQ